MARYKCNAQPPGCYIEGKGIIEFGAEFYVEDHVEPRNSWIPVDDAAKAAFEKHNARVKAEIDAEVKELELTGKEAKEHVKKQSALRLRKPNPSIIMPTKRLTSTIERKRAELEALIEADKEIQNKGKPGAPAAPPAPPARPSDSE